MLWGSFAEYLRHYPGRVLLIVAGALAALMLMAVNAPSVQGAEVSRAGALGAGTLQKAHDGRMPAAMPAYAGHRLADALETAADGESVAWRDPENGAIYRVNPLFSFRVGERDCRAFTIRRIAADSVRESYRTACRRDAGGWTLTTASNVGGNG
jgi:surface antigen